MGLLDDYDFALGKKRPLMPPGTGPTSTLAGFMDPYGAQRAIADLRAGSAPSWGTGSNGFPPTKMDWKPAVDAPVTKLQDRLGPPPDVAAADVADTFSPKPMDGAKPLPQVAFDPSRFNDVPGPPTRTAAPAFPPSRPPGLDAPTRTAAPAFPPSRPAGIDTAALSPAEPPPRPAGLGILSDKPLSPQRPTGVPTATPPPSLVENAPQPPPRPAGLGDPAPAPAPTPASISAPTPPPIIPTSAIGSPIADFGKGGEFGNVAPGGGDDFGSGLGGSLGDGSDDLAFAGGGGGMDLGAGESGGGGDGGGGGGGLGGILGAIGGLAKGLGGGGGGGGSAPAPPVPVAKAPQLAPMAGDPAMAKRAQGAQQIMSGLLADPTLIDPRKKQGSLLT